MRLSVWPFLNFVPFILSILNFQSSNFPHQSYIFSAACNVLWHTSQDEYEVLDISHVRFRYQLRAF